MALLQLCLRSLQGAFPAILARGLLTRLLVLHRLLVHVRNAQHVVVEKAHQKRHVGRPARDARRRDEGEQRLRGSQGRVFRVDLLQRGDERRRRRLADGGVVEREDLEGGREVELQLRRAAEAGDDRRGQPWGVVVADQEGVLEVGDGEGVAGVDC